MSSTRQQRALRAVEKLKELAREGPAAERPVYLRRMAELYRRGGMLAEARKVLDRLLAADPLDLKALLALAGVLVEAGEPERALTISRSLQSTMPGLEETYLLELKCLEAMDQPQEIVRALAAYLGRFPDRHRARLDLAGWLEALGRPGSALREYRTLIETGYRPAGIHERMGALYLRAGDLPLALKSLTEAERLAPGKARVREAIARILYEQKSYPAALDAARKLDAVAPPDSFPARRLLARAALQCREYELAVVAYESLVEAQPESQELRREYAEALFFNGDLRDSAAEYRRVLESDPKDGLAHFRLGEVLRQGYFLEEAEAEYRTAQLLMPSSPVPFERLGDMALAARRHHQAVGAYLRWMMLEPGNPEVHARLGRAYRMLHELENARKHLARAEELGAGSAALFYERVLLERACGQNREARQYARRTLDAGPDARVRALVGHELREMDREEHEARERAAQPPPTSPPPQQWRKLA
ncbi:MAG: tetratricopeptide repeat protein [Candidatus Wallbacteria bacterium]|nr:tetratricopeptide repeat protein [Candidatus Wallbacteria bacterium]